MDVESLSALVNEYWRKEPTWGSPAYLSACKRLTRYPSACQTIMGATDEDTWKYEATGDRFGRAPRQFHGGRLGGQTPAAAIVEKMFDKVPMGQLAKSAQKHIHPDDEIVLEASGNSFQVVRELTQVGREAKVLKSAHVGKLEEGHANNDKLSAVRIGKAHLAGTAKEVWVPDPRTQERRDWNHAYRKTVKRSGQVRSSLRSYLSDNGIRLKPHTRLTELGAAEVPRRQTRT